MTAEQIRKSFVQPQLDALAQDQELDDRRSDALMKWEGLAQLAELNDSLRKIAEKKQ